MRHVELVTCDKDTKCGNHRVVIDSEGIKNLYYYSTIICTVNPSEKTFQLLKRKISVSTSKAIGQYRNYLTMRGYKEVL